MLAMVDGRAPGNIHGMDLAERRRLDAARQQVDKVKTRARPWRSITALVLAVIMAAVSRSARAAAASVVFAGTPYHALGRTWTEVVADAAAAAFLLLAAAATAGLAGRTREVMRPKIGAAHAAVVRYTVVLLGGIATILITLQLFGINVTQLLVGGAFATVLVGIAAQQSMSNVFAGMVLLLARPVDIGDRVWVRSGALGGEFHGDVTEIGISYVRLETPDGPVRLPNSQVLAAAVAPVNGQPRAGGGSPVR
jgi:small-conductance mechanosensitive channel